MDNKTLKEWRLSQNLTQAQAAALTGLTPRHWRKLEAGSTPVSRRLELACQALTAFFDSDERYKNSDER